MDKERIFFLVSESRILSYSSSRQDDDFQESVKEALKLGDTTFRVVEVTVNIPLPPEEDKDELIEVEIKSSCNFEPGFDTRQILAERHMEMEHDFWQGVNEGVYRIKKRRMNDKLMGVVIEYCPDIGDYEWEKVESKGWKR
jgi:hypothetical protein